MDSLSVPDPAVFGLKAQTRGPVSARPGDTLDWTVEITWDSAPHPWLLIPRSSAEARGISQVSVGVEQHKEFIAGAERAAIHVRYRLAITDTGNLRIPALRYEIPLEQGNMVLQTRPFDLRSEQPAHGWIWALPGALVLIAAVVYFKRRRSRRKALEQDIARQRRDLARRLALLERRVSVLKPRDFMRELEALCRDYRSGVGKDQMAAGGWERLDEAFRDARYGGGPKDQWECRAYLRDAREKMSLQSEDVYE